MKLRKLLLVAGVAFATAVLATCTENLLVDPPRGFRNVRLEAVDWPDTLLVGQEGTLSALIIVDGDTVDDPEIHWSSVQPDVLWLDDDYVGGGVHYQAFRSGQAEVRALIRNHDLFPDTSIADVLDVFLAGVRIASPATDTTMTALGDSLTLRAEGVGIGGASVGAVQVNWRQTESGVTALGDTEGDSSVVVATAQGLDTLRITHAGCVGECADTLVIRVDQEPAAVAVSQDTVPFTSLGQQAALSASVADRRGNAIADDTVIWALLEPSDSAIVRLTQHGVATSRANGTVAAVATAGEVADTAQLFVDQVVAELNVVAASDTLVSGDSLRLRPEAYDASDSTVVVQDFSWTSQDETIATVDRNGWVHGHLVGLVDIVAASPDGPADTTALEVVPGAPVLVAIQEDSVILDALGADSVVSVSVEDAAGNAVNSSVLTWTVDSIEVATAAAGRITAAGNGLTRVIASTNGAADTVWARVHQRVTAVTADSNAVDFTEVGGVDTVGLAPVDRNARAVGRVVGWSWASTDSTVATASFLSGNRVEIRAVGYGQAGITADAEGRSDTIAVTVSPDSVVVARSADTLNALGDTVHVQAVVYAGGSTITAPVTWGVLDTLVLQAAGADTAYAATDTGTARIVAAVGLAADTATVQVRQVVASLTVSPDSVELTIGASTGLTVAVADSNGVAVAGAEPVWTSSDTAVARVDSLGTVTAADTGTTLIAAAAGGEADTATVVGTAPSGDLLAYWPLNGDAQDATANGHYGAVVNGPAATTDRFGSASSAFEFDGVDDHLDFGDHDHFDISSADARTIALWFRADSTETDSGGLVTKFYETSGWDARWAVLYTGDESAGLQLQDGTTDDENHRTVNGSLPRDRWHYLVLVIDRPNARLKIFENGSLAHDSTITKTGDLANAEPLLIGRTKYYESFFDGAIDDVRLYGRALADTEIADLYATQKAAVHSIALSADTTTLQVGDTTTLTAIPMSEGDEPLGADVTWSSSNTSVATVDSSGRVIAGGAGTVDVTATSETVTASVTLTVESGSLPPGILAVYPLDGDATDTTSTPLDGALYGPAPAPDRCGVLGGALEFDGVDDYVGLPFNSDSLGGPFTVSAWVYNTKSTTGSEVQGVLSNDASGDRGFALAVADTVRVTLATDDGGPAGAVGDFQQNRWTHLAFTYDGSQLALYVAGQSVQTFSAQGSPTGSTNFRIGSDPYDASSFRFFGGRIDDVRVWRGALTATEVAAVANEACPATGTLRAQYPLNGSVTDVSGNGYTGSTVGAVPGPDRHAQPDSAFVLDGVDDYLLIEDTPTNDRAAGTISLWVRLAAVDSQYNILSKNFDGALPMRVQFSGPVKDSIDGIGFLLADEGWSHAAFSASTTLTSWHQYAVTWDGTEKAIFFDGAELGRWPATGSSPAIGDLYVGNNGSTNHEALQGSVDQLVIFGSALSPTQIDSVYQAEKPVEIPVTDLVAHWTFANCTGADSSGRGHNGTAHGSPVCVQGPVDSAMDFDGVDDYIAIPGSTDFEPGYSDMSVAAWVKYLPDAPDVRVFNAGFGSYLWIQIGGVPGQDSIGFGLKSGTAESQTFAYAAGIKDGQWHHVAGVRQDTHSVKIYVDGALIDSVYNAQLGGVSGSTSTDVLIGHVQAYEYPYNQGGIDDLRVYRRALADTEVRALVMDGNPPVSFGYGFGDEQFALIEAGTFEMGDIAGTGQSDELPVHTVNITQPFYLQKTEVTQAQWQAVMGTNPSYFTACGETCPVEQVNWNDVQAFIDTLNARNPGANYRLPTEAEWEYATRAGTTGEYTGTGVLDEMGWHNGNAGATTHPVAEKLANDWGLYDTHGNVWEWVQDWYAADYYSVSPADDPQGPSNGPFRGLRGGSWSSDAHSSRSALRSGTNPTDRNSRYGVRLARTPEGVAYAPSVSITSPAESSSFADTATITFSALTSDREDGWLSGASVVWTSNLDGQIATDTVFTTNSLSVGQHVIQVTATDSDESSRSDSVLVTILSAETAAYWPFSGDASDVSGNGNDATVSGAVLTTDPHGNPSSAYAFDGVDDYIDIGTGVKPALPVTMAAWIRVDSLKQGMVIRLDQADGFTTYNGLALHYGEDGTLRANMGNGGPAGPASRRSKKSVDAVIATGEWIHVAAVFPTDLQFRLYVNGDTVPGTFGDGTATTLGYSTASGQIGGDPTDTSPTGFVRGAIDEVQVWATELSDSALAALYESERPLVDSLVVTPDSTSIPVDSTVALAADAYNAAGERIPGTVDWASLNSAIAAVDSVGLVTGLAGGTARIVASAGTVTDTAKVVVLASDTAFAETFADGDYTNSPAWTEVNNDDYPGTVSVVDQSLRLYRTGAGGNGGGLGIQIDTLIPVHDSTVVVFDARATYRSVTGGCGSNCGEHPAKVTVYAEDASNAPYALIYSVNYGGVVQDTAYRTNGIEIGVDVPQDTWVRDLSFRLRGAWPEATRITGIFLQGSGWDFEGYVDNVRILHHGVSAQPEPASVNVSPAADTLGAFGDTTRLTATVYDTGGTLLTDAPVIWESLDSGVVTVDSAGLVTAGAGGQTGVVASSGIVADTATVTVVEPRLVAHWSFDACDGTDDSGAGHTATFATTTACVAGVTGSAATFDGSTQWAEVPAHPDWGMGTDPFTVSLWFRTTQNGAYLIDQREDPEHGFVLAIVRDSLAFNVQGQGTLSHLPVAGYNDGAWHHAVGVRSADTTWLYLDGILAAADTASARHDLGAAKAVQLGRRYTRELPYAGSLDEVKLYRGALSAAQVDSLYRLAPAGISLAPAVDTLQPGETVTVSATVVDGAGANLTDPAVAWRSSDSLVATVDSAGLVTGVDTGTVAIIAEAGAAADTVSIVVAGAQVLAHWSFDGDATDASGNGQHGTVYGATLVPDQHGTPDAAYSFDGVDDYFSGPALNPGFPFSATMWVKRVGTGNPILLTGSWDAYWAVYNGFMVQVAPNGGVDFRFGNGSGPGSESTRGALTRDTLAAGEWYHIAVASPGPADIRIYIDGVLQATDPLANTLLTSISLQGTETKVGKDDYDIGSRFWEGTVADLTLYGEALTDAEVESIYQAERPVDQVVVDLPTDSILLGDTTRAGAAAYAPSGGEVTLYPTQWTSRDTAVVTVDSAGLATARGFGGTWLVAEVDGVADSALLTVAPLADTLTHDTLAATFHDNFEDGVIGTQWYTVSGTWTETAGSLHGYWSTGSAQSDQGNILLDTLIYDRDTVAATVTVAPDSGATFVLYNSPGNRYSIAVYPRGANSVRIAGTFRTGGSDYVVFQSDSAAIPTIGTEFEVGIRKRQNVVEVIAEGHRLALFDDTIFNGDTRLGLGVYGDRYYHDFALHGTERSGLLARWPLDGNASDLSGNGHHGTVVGSPTTGADRFGTAGAAFDFDGVDDHLDFGDHADFDIGASDVRTLSLWFRPDVTEDDSGGLITKFYQTPDWDPRWAVTYGTRQALAIQIQDGTTGDDNHATADSSLLRNRWHHVAVLIDRPNARLQVYQNGVLVLDDPIAKTGNLANAEPLLVGRTKYYEAFFDGSIDDVRIYDRLLTASEIADLAADGAVASVSVTPTQDTLTAIGDTLQLNASAGDASGTPLAPTFRWTSLDTLVVAVDSTGLVTASGNGVAAVVATAQGVADTATITVAAPGLVAHWTFDDCTAADSSGHGHDATLYGSPGCTTGPMGSALRFDGVDDYAMTAASDFLDTLNTGTVSFWVRAHQQDLVDGGVLVGYSTDGDGNSTNTFNIDTGAWTWQWKEESPFGVTPHYTSDSSAVAGRWTHLAIVADGTDIVMYVDGDTMTTTLTTNGATVDGSEWYDDLAFVGSYSHFLTMGMLRRSGGTLSNPFSGVLDDVRIYARALEPAELDSLIALGTVPAATVDSVQLSADTVTVDPDSTTQLTATVFDVDGFRLDAAAVSWSSDDAAVATVDSTGLVTGVAAGEALVTATSNSVSASALIRVPDTTAAGYWSLDGTVADESGHGLDGSAFGAVPTADRFGRADSAYWFDGVDDYISLPDLPVPGQFSVSAWIRPEAGQGDILSEHPHVVGSYGFIFFVNQDSTLAAAASQDGTAWTEVFGSTEVVDGAWHYVVLSVDGSTMTTYLDGVEEASVAFTSDAFDPAWRGAIGVRDRDAGLTSFFTGAIDQVRLWSQALTAAEVGSTYDSEKPPPPVAPSGLQLDPISDTSIHLSWTDNSTSEAIFQVGRSTDGGTTWMVVDSVLADTTSHLDIGLDPFQTYTYHVSACNAVGCSASTAPAGSPPVGVLSANGAVSSLGGPSGSQRYFRVAVDGTPPGLDVSTSGGTGDVDLYLRSGALPTTATYDCRPYIGGNSESCSVTDPTGDYYVMLHGFNAYSGVTLAATTNDPPTAGFAVGCSHLVCGFIDESTDSDGTIASWAWDFGDGATSTAADPNHTYSLSGTYTVTLTVTDDDGDSDSYSENVTVTANAAPTASFSVGCSGLICGFIDGSTDSDGTIASWAWEFGDGDTSTASDPNHTYGAGGTYTVTLTVTDDDGDTDSYSESVTVQGPTGSVKVTTSTTGTNIPSGSNAYYALIDYDNSTPISANGSITWSAIATGGHTVTLGNVDSNCTVSGGINRSISVSENQTTTVAFDVTCQ